MADWIGLLLDAWGYAGVALLMLLETVFPPLPSEVIMPLAGVAAAQGKLGLAGVIVAGTTGAMLGNYGWFAVARLAGEERLRRFVRRHGRWLTMDERALERADRWFARWGGWCVGLGRVVPTARSLVSVPAGLLGMDRRRFLVLSTLGTAAWTTALATAGHSLGRHYQQIDDYLEPVASGFMGLLLLIYIFRLARR